MYIKIIQKFIQDMYVEEYIGWTRLIVWLDFLSFVFCDMLMVVLSWGLWGYTWGSFSAIF